MLLQPSDYQIGGLYLTFNDGRIVALTVDEIERRSRAILDDRSRVPDSVRRAAAFQLCSVCPKRGSGETCHAIRPILAVSDVVDSALSHEPVTAVFKSTTTTQIVAADTTLQRALQYVSLLSLLYYCEVGKQYWRYFSGVHPLMSTEELVTRVYLNMFWSSGGDREQTRDLVARFHDEITITTQCQMARLRLVCHNDALLNALILTQIASEFLVDNVEEIVNRHATEFERSFFE